jgi:hypothetical protein
MLMRFLVALFLTSYSFHALGQVVCGEQPTVPADVQGQLKGDAEGNAQIFSRLVGDVRLKGQIETSKNEMYQKYHDLDRSVIDRYMIWVSCQNIMFDKALSAVEKNRMWTDIYRLLVASNQTTQQDKPAPVADKIQLMFAARDICVGVIAKFANTPDPAGDTELTYEQGQFKIIRARTKITILDNNVKVAELPKFDYSSYVDCVSRMSGK